jgi:hypothetical protein
MFATCGTLLMALMLLNGIPETPASPTISAETTTNLDDRRLATGVTQTGLVADQKSPAEPTVHPTDGLMSAVPTSITDNANPLPGTSEVCISIFGEVGGLKEVETRRDTLKAGDIPTGKIGWVTRVKGAGTSPPVTIPTTGRSMPQCHYPDADQQ